MFHVKDADGAFAVVDQGGVVVATFRAIDEAQAFARGKNDGEDVEIEEDGVVFVTAGLSQITRGA